MMYKQITYIFLLALFLSPPIIGQNIEEGNRTELLTKHSVGEVYKSYFVNQEIVLLANTRTPQKLSTLLLIMNQQGELKQEKIIGGKTDTYEHPVALCQNECGLYLLSNRTQQGNKNLILYYLDANYEPISEWEIATSNLEEGTAMIVKNQNRLLITAVISKGNMSVYPRLIELDAKSGQVISELNLNHKNELPSQELETIAQLDPNTMEIIGEVKVLPNQFQSKICNNIICTDASCEDLLLVGYETTDNFTDFWVAKLEGGELVWEQLYKTEKGGDEAFDVFLQGERQYLITGLEYTKNFVRNYELKTMLIDDKGKMLNQQNFKEDARTFYRRAKRLGQGYVLLGESQNRTCSYKNIGKVKPASDISLTILSENLKETKTHTFKTEEKEIVKSMVALPDNRLFVFYKLEDRLMQFGVEIVK